jgi:protein-S-isoprenylcysteine O-methyltransferase Ste14
LSVVALPVTMTVFVPWWIARRYSVSFTVPTGVGAWCALVLGAGTLATGLALFATSFYWFASRGRGTLAPWDPPRRLVIGGPYRYVRNPMISGVMFILVGEALILRSRPHAIWSLIFIGVNLVYIPLFEEPQLEARFGDPYSRYTRHVRRFIPRTRPWHEPEEARSGQRGRRL